MLHGPSEERKPENERSVDSERPALPALLQEIEASIVESLVDRRSDRVISLMQTEEFRATVGNIAMEAVEVMAKTMPNLDLEEFAEGREQIRREIEASLTEPDKIREIARKNSVNHYTGTERFKEQLNEMREGLLLADIDAPDVVASIGRLIADLEALQLPEKLIVRHLTEVAAERGLDAATTKDAYAGAVKSVFPTREDFEQHHASEPKRLMALLERTMEAFERELPDVGAGMAGLLRTITSSGPLESIRLASIQAEADEIYGK